MTGYDLRMWRLGIPMTQEEAARKLHVGLATYKRYEKSGPPVSAVRGIRFMELEKTLDEICKLSRDKMIVRLRTLVTGAPGVLYSDSIVIDSDNQKI